MAASAASVCRLATPAACLAACRGSRPAAEGFVCWPPVAASGRCGARVVAMAKGGKGGKKKGGSAIPKGGQGKKSAEGGVAVDESRPPYTNADIIMHSLELIDSYYRATGRPMFDKAVEVAEAAKELWSAPFLVMSHGTEDDPIFNYGNESALRAFESTWADFTALPSRYSSADPDSPARKELLHQAEEGPKDLKGLVRVSTKGTKFEIDDGVLWTLVATDGERFGQAAVIREWHLLDPPKDDQEQGPATPTSAAPSEQAAGSCGGSSAVQGSTQVDS
ncbi:hypothetical protein CLOP_g25254 [Closterium sp. NIES-67]|nr:hypothetical protein CLOP_g25254 [Closterium sp. NIES-67]